MENTIDASNSTYTVPHLRLHIMRTLFGLNFIGLVYDNWSAIFFPDEIRNTLTGVTISFWAAFSLLNLFGVRYPLKFLPILLLQLLYKTAWIIGTYIPAKNANVLNESLNSFFSICLAGIFLNLLIIPWGYVYREYVKGFLRLG